MIAGKILDDARTLQESAIEEKNFIVVMVSKVGAYQNLFVKVLVFDWDIATIPV